MILLNILLMLLGVEIINMQKVSLYDFLNFERWYWATSQDRLNIRFGQAFLNKMLPNIKDSELFYERNCAQAKGYIIEKYIK